MSEKKSKKIASYFLNLSDSMLTKARELIDGKLMPWCCLAFQRLRCIGLLAVEWPNSVFHRLYIQYVGDNESDSEDDSAAASVTASRKRGKNANYSHMHVIKWLVRAHVY